MVNRILKYSLFAKNHLSTLALKKITFKFTSKSAKRSVMFKITIYVCTLHFKLIIIIIVVQQAILEL